MNKNTGSKACTPKLLYDNDLPLDSIFSIKHRTQS